MSTSPEQQNASELNRGLTQQLAAVGERFGFEVVREYPVKGGRLDVVWTWTPPVAIPGLEVAVPVVGFEIESSWRTRKHVRHAPITCNRESIPVTFAEVEVILGFPLPHSCRHHVAHWHSYEGSAVARAIIDAGWKAAAVDVANETVTLTRVSV